MTTPSRRGAFIVLEGLDRSGKSTQCKLLAEHLNRANISTQLQRFPDRSTPIGHIIDQYLTHAHDLDDRAVHLLFSANRWEARQSLIDRLASGVTLVVDRYVWSGVAFTAAKSVADTDWCLAPERGLPLPDLTFFLTIDASEAEARGGFGDERYEKLEYQRKVREKFLELSEREAKLARPWQLIEAGKGRTIEQIAREIATKTDEFIASLCDSAPINHI